MVMNAFSSKYSYSPITLSNIPTPGEVDTNLGELIDISYAAEVLRVLADYTYKKDKPAHTCGGILNVSARPFVGEISIICSILERRGYEVTLVDGSQGPDDLMYAFSVKPAPF